MCSVSFLPHARGFALGMNRDESRGRAVAQLPAFHLDTGRAALYPSEIGGGTWIGINDSGLCLALINGYAVSPRPDLARATRGRIIPSLLPAPSWQELQAALLALSLPDFAPFRLLVFALREKAVHEFHWDEQNLSATAFPWEARHWFSSGFDEAAAQEERGRVAHAAWSEPRAGRLPWLRRLHGSHLPATGPLSICMHRNDAATVSYTEIVATRYAAIMRYHPGPLCEKPRPATVHALAWQTTSAENLHLRSTSTSTLPG